MGFFDAFPWAEELWNAYLKIKSQELELKKYRSSPMEDYWNNKHTKKLIVYNGRYFPMLNTKIGCPVQLFVMPNDSIIIEDIQASNLGIQDPTKCNADILKIYKHIMSKFAYQYDSIAEKVPELWLFPFERRTVPAADCEDWSHEIASYYIAAGVPAWRVRCVAGTTFGGEGHCTVYVLLDDLKTWKHTNSTTPYSIVRLYNDLTGLPNSGDSTDKIGIMSVWFSYNNRYSWMDFEGTGADLDFLKNKGIEVIGDDSAKRRG